MFSRVGIVRGQAPLSIANSPLPDLVEKLPDAGFIADGPFGIISTVMKPVDSISLGSCVCHVAVMPDGKRVAFADYIGGFAGSVEVADGRFGHVVKHQHSGSGPNLPRQSCAHCHQAIPTPDGKGYCVIDLGLDQIVEYPSGRVFRTLPSGAGPLICFSIRMDASRFSYAMEHSGEVSALGYDAASGAFSEISSLHGLHRPSSVCPLP